MEEESGDQVDTVVARPLKSASAPGSIISHHAAAALMIRSSLVLCALAGCDQGKKNVPPPPPDPATVVSPKTAPTCDEVRPEYTAMMQAQERAYENALKQRGLAQAKLEQIWIKDYNDKEPNQDELLEIIRSHRGKQRRVLVSMSFDRANNDYVGPIELVSDGSGGVWKVQRKHVPTSTKTIVVEACQWGCFGSVPRGAQNPIDYGRHGFVLGDGQTFKGDIVIDFKAPHIIFTSTRNDCSMPG